MSSPHSYAMEIRELLRKDPFCTSFFADDFELLPLSHIDTVLSVLQGNKRMQQSLAAFRITYLTEELINLSMRSLLELKGVHFAENLITSLKGLLEAYKN